MCKDALTYPGKVASSDERRRQTVFCRTPLRDQHDLGLLLHHLKQAHGFDAEESAETLEPLMAYSVHPFAWHLHERPRELGQQLLEPESFSERMHRLPSLFDERCESQQRDPRRDEDGLHVEDE